MKIISSITELRKHLAACRRSRKTIGFVPTMGALHQGHLSLIKASRRENDMTVLSIFVNPTQFGPKEDLKAYPRPKKQDCRLAREAGCDIVFYPSVKTMYPDGQTTVIDVPGVSEGLCGQRRPGHFRGVATVVAKLFHLVMPDNAYFGRKDYQQVTVIKKMVADLNFPIKIKEVATVREPDGLAMSSRNSYLNQCQRREAVILYQSLRAAKDIVRAGERRASVIRASIRRRISQTSGRLDYIACVDAKTLKPVTQFKGTCLIAVAVFFGTTRLIDNIVLQI